ncbi:MAG: hypothetical protein WB586_21080 [Chthoniobacterales bacterium]
MSTRLHNYAEVRAYLEKEHPDWLRALPIQRLDFSVTGEQDAVLVTTYTPEAAISAVYYKSVPVIPGATI